MEGTVQFLKSPAAGVARIGILYKSPALKLCKIFGWGFVRNYPDLKTSILSFLKIGLCGFCYSENA
eukprot:UN27661